MRIAWTAVIASLAVAGFSERSTICAQPPSQPWLYSTARAVPKDLTSEGSGYFALVEGKNGKLYLGTAKYRHNAYLVEYDPETHEFRTVVDCMRAIGSTANGFAAQAKIHTRCNVGPSGKIYFGTKQGYPNQDEKPTDYPGGRPMVYDPATGATRVYPIPIPHHGIISIMPDESRNVAYVSTCSDERPVESSHFLILDLATGSYRDLGETNHMYAFIVVDHLGRAYHPLRGGKIARYDPKTDRVEHLEQTIDGAPPPAESHLADADGHPINWETSPNRRTLYAVAMSGNRLYAYDLTTPGNVLAGKSAGPLCPAAAATDCRALCVAPNGDVWAAVTAEFAGNRRFAHLTSFKPGDPAPVDHGPLAIANPDYTTFTDHRGRALPHHHGVRRFGDGNLLPQHALLGVCAPRNGATYVLSLAPFTLHEVRVPRRSPPPQPERVPIAGIATVYRFNSHADLLLGRMVQTESLDGRGRVPLLRLASLHTDQVPQDDVSRKIAADLAIPIAATVTDALTLGTDGIAVRGAMVVAEHGEYPESPTGATAYPKRRMFEQIFATVDKFGHRGLPVFCDKHLADDWRDAKWIYDEARRRDMPLMAGSSLPSAWRNPPLDVPRDACLREVCVVSYHKLDVYGFHALEALQALVERRRGGETGVEAVQTLEGEEVWRAADRGVYDRKLLDEALAAMREQPLPPGKRVEELAKRPLLCVLEYRDGLKACLFTLDGATADWTAAWKDDAGRTAATCFVLQEERPFSHFAIFFNAVEQFLLTKTAPWPVERTLLTSGLVDELLKSKHDGGTRRETPHLDVRYRTAWNWILPAQPVPIRPRGMQ